MHTIKDVTERDFRRLQKYAEPLVDTPATVLTKVLDLLEKATPASESAPAEKPAMPSGATRYRPADLPPLTHTKLMAGEFGGVLPEKASWDAMVRLALVSLMEELNDVAGVRGKSGANIVAGEKTNDGYKFLKQHGFSYQGVSAEAACEIIVRSARALNRKASMEFVWRDKPEAFKPGAAGRIEV